MEMYVYVRMCVCACMYMCMYECIMYVGRYISFDTDKERDLLQERPVLSTGRIAPWQANPQLS
jgi:hypothetical protein